MLLRLNIVAALVLALAVLAGGCGGDSDTTAAAGTGGADTTAASDSDSDTTAADDSGNGKPLTKAQFVKQADAICAKTKKRQSAALTAYLEANEGIGGKDGQEEIILEAALPPIEQQNEELRELVPPQGDEAEVEAIITGFEEAVEKSEADPEPLFRGRGAFGPAGKKAAAYGLKTCAE